MTLVTSVYKMSIDYFQVNVNHVTKLSDFDFFVANFVEC